ncbi:MAG: acyl-CoA dehydrogenase family protein [bacterium]
MQLTQFYSFTDEQLAFKKEIDQFVENEIRPHAREWDEMEKCPLEIFEKLAALDCLATGFPETVGGVGGMVELLLLIESLAAGSAGVALSVYVHMALACAAIEALGNDEQKKRYLLPAMKAKKLGCWAYAEPNAGADVTAVQCRAQPSGDDFILNGSKLYITNGTFADFVVLAARTAEGSGLKGISLFIVDREQPGFARNEMKKLGMRSSELAELVFTDCRVTREQLLGPMDSGFRKAIQVLSRGRAVAAAFACGLAGEALRQTVEHVSNRQQRGSPLITNQFIRFTLADMKTRLEASRLMTYASARLLDAGKPFDTECSIAKLFATESATWICERALHLHGAQGYMMESDIQRFYRDCKVLEFGEGTSEIQREMIAGALLR